MPEPSETSPIVAITSLASDVEETTYETLIASTVRRSTWFMGHYGQQNSRSGIPLARIDIATGPPGEEVDAIPDLGGGYSGGTGAAGMGHITVSKPFVFEKGVRVSARMRNPSVAQIFDLGIRLIE